MTEEELARGLMFVAFGIAYSLAGYLKNVTNNPDTKFSLKHAGTTVLLGGVAGVVMMTQGEEMSSEALVGAMAVAIPIADKILNIFLEDPEVEAPPIK